MEEFLEKLSCSKVFAVGLSLLNVAIGAFIVATQSTFWPLSAYPMFAVRSVPLTEVRVPRVALTKSDGSLEWVPKKKRLSHLPIDYRQIEALERKDYQQLDLLLSLILLKNPEYLESMQYKSVVLVMRSIENDRIIHELKIKRPQN